MSRSYETDHSSSAFCGAHPFGTTGRNVVKSPATYQADLRLQKHFPVSERAPDSSHSSSNFGAITNAFPARVMQFALRFAF